MQPEEFRMNLENEMKTSRDWRRALRSPPGYRVIVNRTLRGQTQLVTLVVIFGIILLVLLYLFPDSKVPNFPKVVKNGNYNYRYPLSSPIEKNSMYVFRIGIIADLDTKSKSTTEKHMWYSYLKKGFLTYTPGTHNVALSWDKGDPVQLKGSYSLKGRGMELSELVVFNGRLLTFDDRTGLVFEIINDKVYPWILLMDGDGKSSKGFKSEWATVKDELLYVGSMGKEWTTSSGEFVNNDPQYVKVVNTKGEILHVNWMNEYKRIREVLDIRWPGYMIHECALWSDVHKKWFFLPRRCSKESYNETLDETRGCSVLITADPSLYDIRVIKIPGAHISRGFSSFKFIPKSNDYVIAALRTEELDGKTATYFSCFTIEGHLIMDDVYISDLKYEGLEFI